MATKSFTNEQRFSYSGAKRLLNAFENANRKVTDVKLPNNITYLKRTDKEKIKSFLSNTQIKK